MGKQATANGQDSIAIGTSTFAGARESTAIGDNCQATAQPSLAVGATCEAKAINTIAIGFSTFAQKANSTSIGTSVNLQSSVGNSVGIGNNIQATNGDNQVVIGNGVRSFQGGAIAIGHIAHVDATNGLAIGGGARINTGATRGIAIGSGSVVTQANGINIGGIYTYNGSNLATINTSLRTVGSVSASLFNGNGSGLTNVTASSANSASYAETSSFAAGNFEVSGQIFSPVFSGSIASSTSSVDFNNGNFAVITLTSPTRIENPSNIKSGTTYTLIINSGSLVTTYGSAFKFPGGVQPTLSNDLSLITMVSDGSRLLAVGLDDFA
jgi:hypothetical protein